MIYNITPMGAVRMNKSDAWRKRPSVLKYFAYKDEIRLKINPQDVPVGAKVIFHVPMAKSWSVKDKSAMAGQPHMNKPDLDNFLKGLWDALYENDSHIWKVNAEKRWSYEGAIEIEV